MDLMVRLWTRRKFLGMTATTAGVVYGVRPVLGQPLNVPQTKKAMRIGIIGAGNQGGNLGLNWAKAGHELLFSSRNPASLKELVASAGPRARAGRPDEAARFGEVVLIAVPYGALPQVGKDYSPLMRGKVVIDCSNAVLERDGGIANDAQSRGTGVVSAELLPGVRLIRAFNALGYQQVRQDAFRVGEKFGIPVAGDDVSALAVAEQLVTDAGFDPVVVGGLGPVRK